MTKKNGVKIVDVRAYIVGQGADYHDQAQDHWIVGHVSTPMGRYEKYRYTRSSFGLNALKTVVVEVETDTGVVGFGVSTGGVPAAWLVENHLARFIIGQDPAHLEIMWDQMYRASMFYGRKGMAMFAISAVDLALWDLLGRLRDEPVYTMLGGNVRDNIEFYATGPRPDLAQKMGFIGGKLPLQYGPSEGEEGLNQNLAKAREMRERVGPDFWLMYDCWMSLDVPYALRLMEGLDPLKFKWVEECLNPDDYWGYAEIKRKAPRDMMVTTGEHEATQLGFRMLLEMDCCDFIQPDVGWCGGMTELIKISNLANAHQKMVIPHGSSVYSYHFVITRTNSPFAEFLMMHEDASEVVPMFRPMLEGEPVPENGKINVSKLDKPGFGVELNRELNYTRVDK